MSHKMASMGLVLLLCMGMLAGCSQPAPASPAATEPPQEEITLTVAGGWTECRALDEVGKAFTQAYPNCTIVYEYLQDYYPSLERRMSGEDKVDLFFTTNIQQGNTLLPYALDLNSRTDIDLSQTFDGLIENFTFMEPQAQSKKLYAVPVGAEMRGMYVNKTLLSSLSLDVPTDQASFLAACETLVRNGYIPVQGNPSSFGQLLVYPWICNLIANAEDPKAARERVDAREKDLVEMFSEPLSFLYSLVEKGYYDYKKAQTELNLFMDVTNEAYARDFFNIRSKDDDVYEKVDDLGIVAFMPIAMSAGTTVDKIHEDYHSEIEYVFIPSPVGPDGGFVYLSPTHGIAVCKDSPKLDWCAKFLSFLMQPNNNETFAKAFNVIPNTKDSFAYIKTLFNIPDERVSHLGEVTFSYSIYDTLQPTLVNISKANNPKYMLDDGAGNVTMYSYDHFIQELEADIAKQ